MNSYRVAGKLRLSEECGCPYCGGHYNIVKVDEIVDAEDESDAAQTVLGKHREASDSYEAKWEKPPEVQIQTEEIYMRRIKAPELLGEKP